MSLLGNGLSAAKHYEDALTVGEAELSMLLRLDASEESILVAQRNLASTYRALGRCEDSMRLRRDVYLGTLKLLGNDHRDTLLEANNYAISLLDLEHYAEAKALLRKMMPVARRVLGESNETTLRMRMGYAAAICCDAGTTLDDLREAVTTLEDTARTARYVLGDAHPTARAIEFALRKARAALRAREEAAPDDVSSVCEEMAAMTPPGDS